MKAAIIILLMSMATPILAHDLGPATSSFICKRCRQVVTRHRCRQCKQRVEIHQNGLNNPTDNPMINPQNISNRPSPNLLNQPPAEMQAHGGNQGSGTSRPLSNGTSNGISARNVLAEDPIPAPPPYVQATTAATVAGGWRLETLNNRSQISSSCDAVLLPNQYGMCVAVVSTSCLMNPLGELALDSVLTGQKTPVKNENGSIKFPVRFRGPGFEVKEADAFVNQGFREEGNNDIASVVWKCETPPPVPTISLATTNRLKSDDSISNSIIVGRASQNQPGGPLVKRNASGLWELVGVKSSVSLQNPSESKAVVPDGLSFLDTILASIKGDRKDLPHAKGILAGNQPNPRSLLGSDSMKISAGAAMNGPRSEVPIVTEKELGNPRDWTVIKCAVDGCTLKSKVTGTIVKAKLSDAFKAANEKAEASGTPVTLKPVTPPQKSEVDKPKFKLGTTYAIDGGMKQLVFNLERNKRAGIKTRILFSSNECSVCPAAKAAFKNRAFEDRDPTTVYMIFNQPLLEVVPGNAVIGQSVDAFPTERTY